MKPTSTRSLVQASLLRPSPVFTEELMGKLAIKANLRRAYRRTALLAGVCCGVLLMGLALAPLVHYLSFDGMKGLSIGLKVSGGLFTFLVLNQLIVYRASLHR